MFHISKTFDVKMTASLSMFVIFLSYTVRKIEFDCKLLSFYFASINVYVKLINKFQNCLVQKPISRVKNHFGSIS